MSKFKKGETAIIMAAYHNSDFNYIGKECIILDVGNFESFTGRKYEYKIDVKGIHAYANPERLDKLTSHSNRSSCDKVYIATGWAPEAATL